MWTQFSDMHSGGGTKEQWDKIYVELPRKQAEVWFYNRFGHSPRRVSCTCCGEDYSISEGTPKQLTAFHRGCRYDNKLGRYVEEVDERFSWKKYQTLDEYKKQDSVLIVPREDILDRELEGDVPEQGYVWVD